MEPSEEIRRVVHRWLVANRDGDADAVLARISERPGLLAIGTDPGEWWHTPERAVWRRQVEESGGFPLDWGEIEAWEEGTVGWAGMMITLVENAIKHGIEPWPPGGRVDVTASVDDDRVELVVSDTGAGIDEAPAPGAGIGLANIRERLALLYGDAATLELAENEPRGFSARILLPGGRPTALAPDRHSVTEAGAP